MFDTLTEKFQNLFSSLSKNKQITESNIAQAVRDVRLVLLEADVNYAVASTLVKKIKEKAIGDAVLKSIKPQQQFTKIVHDELKSIMGTDSVLLDIEETPSVVMMCGLQGSGKTTHAAKLANYIQKNHNKKVMMAACDLQRPAAIEQLHKLGSEIGVDVFSCNNEKNTLKVAKQALIKAKEENCDVLIIDTAGRLHVDEELMQELEDIKKIVAPQEVLFVANATTGQDAVKTAAAFNDRIDITGSILTMLDSDARGGAAISILEVTQKPLKFEGIGEKIADIQVFNPSSMADRILGMGDVINLVRLAEENIDAKASDKLEKKIKSASFNYSDYLKQMKMIKKMGSFGGLMKMVPGLSSLGDISGSEGELKKVESMILSMTLNERWERCELTYTRKKRIAAGSGTRVDDVNRLVKGFKKIKKLLKTMPKNFKKNGLKGMVPNMNQLKKQIEEGGSNLWR
jgi:signal recognition particle subunit SRP54